MAEFKESKIQFMDFNEHAQGKGMWAGSQINSEHSTFLFDEEDGVFQKQTETYSIAMVKYYDEILVNALDQYVRSPNAPDEYGGPVTQISVKFDKSTGFCEVENNGPGFPVEKLEKLKGRYSVEGAMTQPFSSSNHEHNPDHVTGGVNGVGMKVVNSNCDYFEIETVDWKRNVFYRQSCEKGMSKVNDPLVVDLSDKKATANAKLTATQKRPHTKVRFKLNFAHVCRESTKRSNPDWYKDPNHQQLVEKLIEFRVYQLALFIASINYRVENKQRIEYTKKAKVLFNGNLVKIKNAKQYAELFGIVESVQTTLEGPKFPWTICFGDNMSRHTGWSTMDAKELTQILQDENMSIINGVYISTRTNHLNPIFNQLANELTPKAEKALKRKYTTAQFGKILRKLLYVFDCRHIPVAQIFNSQSKDNMSIGQKMLNKWSKDYVIPSKVVAQIWKMIQPKLEHWILGSGKTQTRSKYIRKYEPAKKAGKKDALNCSLLVPEGDSAAKPMRDILTNKKHGLGKSLYGLYNIQGVPPNALKETTEKRTLGGKVILQKSVTLQRNVAFGGLVDALNLNYNYKYYTGPDLKRRAQGDKEFATLNYGCIIAAVDQDLDGIGQIFSLIMVFIARFWPCLIKRGFVKRFATAIVRVYVSNGEVIEFFSNREYLDWKKREFNLDEDEDPPKPKYDVRYYKGLATHTPEEVDHMGATFHNNIFTYIWDDDAEKYMDIYFGPESDNRKDALSTPVTCEYDQALFRKQMIKCSEHFRIEAKAQKLDFVARKLKHSIDGMIPVQRKAFAGARKVFAVDKSPKKVYQVTGRVSTSMCYQHGDTSMSGAIIKMAQTHTGCCNLPLFVPISNGFGDRTLDRGTTGAPRYIETKLNYKLSDALFPPEDDWMLEYVHEEGQQCEPKYYVPVIPYSILESITTPSAGWSITASARQFEIITQAVREMIEWEYPEPAGKPQPLNKRVWTKPGMHIEYMIYAGSNAGRVEKVAEVCVGSYEWNPDKDEIIITQLPPQIWTYPYKCKLLGIDPDNGKTTNRQGKPLPKKEHVKSVSDDTGNDEVRIVIKLNPGAYDQICATYGDEFIDPIEDYFGLAKQMRPHLNMLLKDGAVRSFDKYEEVLEYWFSHRKDMYNQRIERQRLLLEFQIDFWENVLRFIEMDAREEINIDRKPDAERVQILAGFCFQIFNKTVLFQPKYIPSDQLRSRIYDKENGASYKYIDQITIGDKSKNNFEKLVRKIEELTAELENLRKTTYKELWLKELTTLENVVQEGFKTDWLFTTKKHKFIKAAQPKRGRGPPGETPKTP